MTRVFVCYCLFHCMIVDVPDIVRIIFRFSMNLFLWTIRRTFSPLIFLDDNNSSSCLKKSADLIDSIESLKKRLRYHKLSPLLSLLDLIFLRMLAHDCYLPVALVKVGRRQEWALSWKGKNHLNQPALGREASAAATSADLAITRIFSDLGQWWTSI
jgi:hypothetical protein